MAAPAAREPTGAEDGRGADGGDTSSVGRAAIGAGWRGQWGGGASPARRGGHDLWVNSAYGETIAAATMAAEWEGEEGNLKPRWIPS